MVAATGTRDRSRTKIRTDHVVTATRTRDRSRTKVRTGHVITAIRTRDRTALDSKKSCFSCYRDRDLVILFFVSAVQHKIDWKLKAK